MSLKKVLCTGAAALAVMVGAAVPTAHATPALQVEVTDGSCGTIGLISVANVEVTFTNSTGNPIDLTIEVASDDGTSTTNYTAPVGASVQSFVVDSLGSTVITVTYGNQEFVLDHLDPCNLPDITPVPEGFDVSLQARCTDGAPELRAVLTNNSQVTYLVAAMVFDADGDFLGGLPVSLDGGESLDTDWGPVTPGNAAKAGVYQYNGTLGAPITEIAIPDCSGSGAGIPDAGTSSALWLSLAGLLLVVAGGTVVFATRRTV